MKKIVAIVLAMVMVLGLATTAFAANLTGTYGVQGTAKDAAKGLGYTVSVTDAKAPKDLDKPADGIQADEVGNVKYFTITSAAGDVWPANYVQVASVADADLVITYGDTDTVFAYVKAADSVTYYGDAVAFNNFGEKCGQFDYEPTADAKYYTFQKGVYEAVKANADIYLMVDGVMTGMKALNIAPVAHTPAYTYDKDYKVVGVKCAECGVVATIFANYAAVPKADKADAVALAGGAYYVWTNAVEAPAAGTVESAKTFDAGIAMYVGMSVMAAAGSAVVLKKKD